MHRGGISVERDLGVVISHHGVSRDRMEEAWDDESDSTVVSLSD